jgi:hypothetical protein
MSCDGAIQRTNTGFEVQIRSDKDQAVLPSDVDASKMTPRERFTLAHEISHTFFYDAQFRPVQPQPSKQLLEGLCNYGAQCLLLPEFLIEREIGQGSRFDSIEMALDLADLARVSPEVVLRRVDECQHLKDGDYALVMLDKKEDGAMITVAVCLNGVFAALTKPKLHAEPPAWLIKLAPALASPKKGACRVPRDAQWDYVSRVVPNSRRREQVFVELTLDLNVKMGGK